MTAGTRAGQGWATPERGNGTGREAGDAKRVGGGGWGVLQGEQGEQGASGEEGGVA